MTLTSAPTGHRFTGRLFALSLLCVLRANGLLTVSPVAIGRSVQQQYRVRNTIFYSSNDPNVYDDRFGMAQSYDAELIVGDDKYLHYRNQIDSLRMEVRSLEEQTETYRSDSIHQDAPKSTEDKLCKLRAKLGALQEQLVQRGNDRPSWNTSQQKGTKTRQLSSPGASLTDLRTTFGKSSDKALDIMSMVKIEEFRAKLRIAEQQAAARPASAADVFLQSFNGQLNMSPREGSPVTSTQLTSGSTVATAPLDGASEMLGPDALPNEVEELQRMVMAYHRFMKHTLENSENEKKKAVQEAEARMKKKFLPIITDLEKANVELRSNQKEGFRLF